MSEKQAFIVTRKLAFRGLANWLNNLSSDLKDAKELRRAIE